MLRFAIPMLLTLAPRFLPQMIRYVLLVWRLTFDRRVNIVLRLLAPLALLYILLPTDLIKDGVPIIGRFDDFIALGLALLFLVKLSPRQVVAEHLGKRPASRRPEDKDPSRVVDGSARFIDEE